MAELYFTYGSNLDPRQMHQQCPGATVAGPARLAGYRLAFSRYSRDWRGGVADIVSDPSAEVWGLLYTLTPEDLETLDRYADCPRTYHRRFVEVDTPAGAKQEVWTYLVPEKLSFVPPAARYRQLLVLAAGQWGFPEPYRDALYAVLTREEAATRGVLYFAYGSNLSTSQMETRCPGSYVVGPAQLAGYRLTFDHSSRMWGGGVADIVPDPQSEVWGLLYALTQEDIERLDRFEGYPSLYRREIVRVADAGGARRDAWSYMVARSEGAVPPSTRYLNVLRAAADKWDFPEHYRIALRDIAPMRPGAMATRKEP